MIYSSINSNTVLQPVIHASIFAAPTPKRLETNKTFCFVSHAPPTKRPPSLLCRSLSTPSFACGRRRVARRILSNLYSHQCHYSVRSSIYTALYMGTLCVHMRWARMLQPTAHRPTNRTRGFLGAQCACVCMWLYSHHIHWIIMNPTSVKLPQLMHTRHKLHTSRYDEWTTIVCSCVRSAAVAAPVGGPTWAYRRRLTASHLLHQYNSHQMFV